MQTGRDALLAHRPDRNPVLGWCVRNVVGRRDRRGDLYPAKARSERKIDAAVALTMAIGRAQASEAAPRPDITAFFTDPLFA